MAYDVLFNEVNDNNEHLFQCMIYVIKSLILFHTLIGCGLSSAP